MRNENILLESIGNDTDSSVEEMIFDIRPRRIKESETVERSDLYSEERVDSYSKNFFYPDQEEHEKSETEPETLPGNGSRTRFSPEDIRHINRFITRQVSDEAKDALIEEHKSLVNKMFQEGLSEREKRRLTFVRWQLDRIDDANEGYVLDALTEFVEEYEAFAENIKEIIKKIG